MLQLILKILLLKNKWKFLIVVTIVVLKSWRITLISIEVKNKTIKNISMRMNMKCKIELVLCFLLCLLKQLRMKMTLGMHCVKKMKELTS